MLKKQRNMKQTLDIWAKDLHWEGKIRLDRALKGYDLQGASDTAAGAMQICARACVRAEGVVGGGALSYGSFFVIGCMDVIVQRTSPLSHTSGILYIIIYINTQL